MSDNPEDYELVHYGVKGMKWGRRKAQAVGSAIAGAEKKRMEFAKEHGYGAQIKKASGRRAEKKAAREKEDTEIGEARLRQVGRSSKIDQKHNKAIEAFVTGDQAKSDRLMAQAQKMEVDALDHPDQAMATKLTSGERRVRRVNNVAMATVMAASVAIAVKSAY